MANQDEEQGKDFDEDNQEFDGGWLHGIFD
jgi:hypothetical protein